MAALGVWAAGEGSRPIVIRGETILTMAGSAIESGTVIVQEGKISAVGKDIPVPHDAEVTDANGNTSHLA